MGRTAGRLAIYPKKKWFIMTRLWLVRHGETDWNLEGRYQGISDVPLNANGRSQAQEMGKILASNGISYQAVYSSPLKRAYETAIIIAHWLRLPVCVDERLREMELGEWEAMLYAEIDGKFPEKIRERQTNAANTHAPGGENAIVVAERMSQAADEIAASHPGEDVIVVTHGMSIKTLSAVAEGNGFDRIYQDMPPHLEPVLVEWTPPGRNAYS
jgi:broad specificity phosphatase PhoE